MKRVLNFLASSKKRRSLQVLLLFILGCASGAAQTFEYVYGSNTCSEFGNRGVAPIVNCAGGGYIAVGTSDFGGGVACGNSDVYVVRTNNLGARTWEFTYDITGFGAVDYGASIVELSDGTGFVVTGQTDVGGGNMDIFLMKINCAGGVVWTWTYGGAAQEDATDIIEAATFTVGNPYDLVVCGSTWSTTPGNSDAFLLRTTSTGVMLWNAAYHQTEHEWFNALTEATPTLTPGGGVQVVGDIIAVGARKAAPPIVPAAFYQGYVARVDGTNGTITPVFPLLQNTADYGGPQASDELFTSVVELQSPAEFPNVAIAGYTTNVTAGSEIYMVKTNGDPCVQLAQNLIGDGVAGPNWDGAMDMKEVMNGLPIAAVGDLALTGFTDVVGVNMGRDAFLLTVTPGGLTPLTPVAGSGNLYGDFGANNDIGNSIHEVVANPGIGINAGFVIAGSSQSDFQVVGDPFDLYLLKTRPNGTTGPVAPGVPCSNTWAPGAVNPGWIPTCLTPVISSITAQTNQFPATNNPFWPFRRCFTVTGTKKEGSQNDGVSGVPGISATGTIRSYPNPVQHGSVVTVEAPVTSARDIMVRLVDETGAVVWKTVYRNDGMPTLGVSTEGLSSGVYTIVIGDGETMETIRIVVE